MWAASALVPALPKPYRRPLSLIGDPSDSNWNSYFRPFPSAASQETLDTCWVAKFPTCLQIPVDSSTAGVGNPSTLGLSFGF
jgi:hypothetical protein